MSTSEDEAKKKRPGPRPKLITLHPFTFDEVVDTLLKKKPEKVKDQLGGDPKEVKEVNEEKGA